MHPSRLIPAHKIRAAEALAEVKPAKATRIRKPKVKAKAVRVGKSKLPRALVDQLKDRGA